ncbi:MAG: zinc ribbon domain-containing protein, partial [Owenweeksia sp.]
WVIQPTPSIVSEELWEAVNTIIKQQKKGAKPRRNPTHLFSGLMQCHCGEKMYVLHSRKYVCPTCRNKIAAADMETIFIEQLRKMVFNPNAVENLLDEVNSEMRDKEKLLASLHKEKSKLKKQLDQLLELQRMGELPLQGFKAHYGPVYEQFEQISEQIPDLETEIHDQQKKEVVSQNAILDTQIICEQWKDYTRDEKKIMINTFIKEIIVNEDDLTIVLHGLALNETEDKRPFSLGSSSKSNARVSLWIF